MSYIVQDSPFIGAGRDESSNITSWEYQGFSAASDDNGGLPADDLATQTSNRWTVQGYFTDLPTIIDPDKGCSIYDGGSWYVEGTETNFRIYYPNLAENQDDIHSVAHYPDSDTNDGDFSVSIGYSVGPISAGKKIALFPSVSLTNDSYIETTWKFDPGIANEDLPANEEDTRGVRWDYEAESSTGYYEPYIDQSYSWQVIHQCSGTEVVTSETPDLLHINGIDIV
jgi:hypothetical protein